MGIECMRIALDGKEGRLDYKNKTGDKTLFFAIGENRFGKFPEDGYSDLIGSKRAPGNKYDCAVSGAWVGDHELLLKVQLIDRYFGKLVIRLSFKGDEVTVNMSKCAENFLDEYSGIAHGKVSCD